MTGADTARLRTAQIDWTDGAPRSAAFGDVYFSGDGAAEAGHVFLQGNDLAARFAQGGCFAIGELGFGTGLNFLKTWALWNAATKPSRARLRFFSVEAFPLGAADMERAHAAWPDLSPLASRLRAAMPPAVGGVHQVDIAEDVTLVLAYGEAGAMLQRVEGGVDAWFLDGFSPAKNPDMWRTEVLAGVARLSRPNASLATFTVAGEVRRTLASVGFAVEKRAGFGRKKEMLAGHIGAPPRLSARAPWFQDAKPRLLAPGAKIAIIGGGIAGASIAREARRAGLKPVIFDPQGLAAGASGNPAGIVMPRLDLGETAASQFFVAAYLHVIRLLKELNGVTTFFNPCGVLLGASDDADRERRRKILEANLLSEGWIEARTDGLFFPQAGVVSPPEFVAALAGATPVIKSKVTRIVSGDDPAVVLVDGSRCGFDAVILANGIDALSFVEARSLPLTPSAGQIDWFPSARAPDCAIACGPYVAPAPNLDGKSGGLIIGATYEKIAAGAPASASRAATEENIAAVARFAPELAAALRPQDSQSRAALRCQTPDRLPVAGPLPDLAFFGGAYDDLRLGRQRDYPPAEMIPGVFILSGLGSRGLVTAPLAAAMIVAEMTGAPSPVSHEIAEALHPARFFIRDLKRAQTIRKG